MLTKQDLKLFEILDKETDKTFGFGAYINTKYGVQKLTLSNFVNGKLKSFYNMFDDKFKGSDFIDILGQYPTTNEVLRYMYIDEVDLHLGNLIMTMNNRDYIFDTSKPIQNYSEEQKKELIKFLESIK